MMDSRDYNTLEGVANNLATLTSLHKLLAARKQAAKKGDELAEFVVMGRFRLDSRGQLFHSEGLVLKELFPTIEDVVEAEIADAMMRNHIEALGKSVYRYGWFMSSNTYLPEADIPCKVCGQFWRTNNAHDCAVRTVREYIRAEEFFGIFIGRPVEEFFAHVAKRRNAKYWPGQLVRHPRFIDKNAERPNLQGWELLTELGGQEYQVCKGDEIEVSRLDYYHNACLKSMIATRTRTAFDTLFQFAGFKHYDLRQLPDSEASEYLLYAGPWFEVLTDFGMIKIGNRKRVMVIDWSATERKLAHLFQDSQNTGSEYSIHAYLGTSQPLEYLTRIRIKLSKELVSA